MITKKTDYAIRALWELARNSNCQVTATQIAHRQSIPPKYLPQIMSELSRAGLVISSRGFGGGLKLGRQSREITLLDIIEAIQGKLQLFECKTAKLECIHLPDCGLRNIFSQTIATLESKFRSTRLSDLRLSQSARGNNA